jgi:hypothetical protein
MRERENDIDKLQDLLLKIRHCIISQDRIFLIGVFFFFLTSFLYFTSPDDPSGIMTTPYLSRFIWTPAIPISISLSITSFLFGSLSGLFERKQTHISFVMVCFLILIVGQLSIMSPMGGDGFTFTESAMRYRDYGANPDYSMTYKDNPLILLIQVPLILIWPSQAFTFSTIGGLLLCLSYLYLLGKSISNFRGFERWGVLAGLIFCTTVSIWWNPMQFSAQLLAIVMIYYVFYLGIGRDGKHDSSSLVIAFLIPLTHIFTPWFFIGALYIESLQRRLSSRSALKLATISSISYIAWHTKMSVEFWHRMPQGIGMEGLLLSPAPYLSILLIHFLIWHFFLDGGKPEDLREMEPEGVSNLSLVISSILILPIIGYIDLQRGLASFAPRLIIYNSIPMVFWVSSFSYSSLKLARAIPSRLDFKSINWDDLLDKAAPLGIVCILFSSFATVAHLNISSRTFALPEETSNCWDEAENLGVANIVTRTAWAIPEEEYEGNKLLRSPMLVPPIRDVYWEEQMAAISESNKWRNPEEIEMLAVIMMTPDMPSRLQEYGFYIDNKNWSLIGSFNGACDVWVKDQLIDNLDPLIHWDTRFICHDPETNYKC